MTAALHLDLVALDRDLARSGVYTLLELLEEDPPTMPVHCAGCGVKTLVPDGIERSQGRPFLDIWLWNHRHCGRGGVK